METVALPCLLYSTPMNREAHYHGSVLQRNLHRESFAENHGNNPTTTFVDGPKRNI